MSFRYPCTRHITLDGFGAYLEKESKTSRYNINKFSEELKEKFGMPYLTLTNSGSSANLVAALALAEKVRTAGKPLTAAISAFTFPTTISSLILAGFETEIIDIEQGGFNISPEFLEKKGKRF